MSYRPKEPSTGEGDGSLEERDLVICAQRGDQIAFEKLYERYNNRICRYLIRMVGDDGVGCELAQETFLKAWEALLSLRDPACFASWLYRIATTRAYNHQNRARLLRTVSWEEVSLSGSESLSISSPERQIEDTELMKHVLASVSQTYRPCFILYVIEKLPQKQIADLLGIKFSSVSKYVSRGKEEFRQIYYRMLKEDQIQEERKR